MDIRRSPGEPPVLAFDPVSGWELAGRGRRLLVVLAAPLFVSWWLAVQGLFPRLLEDVVTGLVLGVGPLTCYAVARVLRPHPPGVGSERVLRHGVASTAFAHGLVTLIGWTAPWPTAVPGYGMIFWLFSTPALLSVPVTLAWGLTAAGCRTCRWVRADLTA